MYPLLISALCLFIYMCGAFILALVHKNNGIADILYGGAFIVVAWVSYILGEHSITGDLLTILVTIWGSRLMVRIYRRNHDKPEDFRYKVWRDTWGKTFYIRSFFQIYMLQGSIAYIVALPVVLGNIFPGMFTMYVFSGVVLWAVGFVCEAVGDSQLDVFMQNPENKGHIMQSGLWKYTRHPNYFGESLMWWSLALVSFAAIFPVIGSVAFIVWASPLLITSLLLFVSGVPLLEKRFEGNIEWEAYKAKTSMFIPMPQRK
jgi:steroid 5-alpha reductase family enzyme